MEHSLQSQKTFRYFTHGDISTAKKVIYVLHGYGQLAEYFLNNFQNLDSEYFIVAPEGMHRFYIKGTSGRVGASWMTKEARNQDIQDTIQWLDNLDKEINSKNNFEKKIILGFSQGGATAARWDSLGKINADTIIYWASVFPPDLESQISDKRNLNQNKYFIIGNKDEYFTDDQRENVLEYYSQNSFKTLVFEGKHSINFDTLKLVLKHC